MDQDQKFQEPTAEPVNENQTGPDVISQDGSYSQTASEHFTERPYEPIPPRAEPQAAEPAPSYAPYYAMPVPPKKKKGKGGLIALLCIALFLVGVVVGYVLITWLGTNPFGIGARRDGQPQTNLTDPNLPAADQDLTNRNFAPVYGDDDTVYTAAEIYRNSIDAIVGVSTEITQRNIFGQEATYAVSGTGFFISEEGYILTNCHLVESANSITVTLYDGSEYPAKLIGKDSQNDVAVLQVTTEQTPSILKIGKSADMVVGEDVLIIGNPLGELTYTMTRGIVSNLSRDIMTDQSPTTIHMFQTDAAINSGNSGGPALDCHGNVIGIASAKYTSSSIEGICFCIPIDDAMKVANDLIRDGYVKGRAYLGVSNLQAVSGYAGTQYVAGVKIGGVVSGSCAEKSGLRAGDIITEFGGKAVDSATSLRSALSKYEAGDEVEIRVFRNTEYVLVTLVLDEAPANLE